MSSLPKAFNDVVAEIMREETRYAAESYEFVSEAVNFTVSRLESPRHVSAAELLRGAELFARREFGVLAAEVLDQWGVVTGEDIGNIVYLLIDAGVLSASPDDDPADFRLPAPLFAAETRTEPAAPRKPRPKVM